MASGIQFSGLVSGLDTQGIIDKLMAIESRPITLLMQRRGTIQSQSDAFKNINTKLSALQDKAFELTKLSIIKARTATSSNTAKLTVSATSDALLDSFNVKINTRRFYYEKICFDFLSINLLPLFCI